MHNEQTQNELPAQAKPGSQNLYAVALAFSAVAAFHGIDPAPVVTRHPAVKAAPHLFSNCGRAPLLVSTASSSGCISNRGHLSKPIFILPPASATPASVTPKMV